MPVSLNLAECLPSSCAPAGGHQCSRIARDLQGLRKPSGKSIWRISLEYECKEDFYSKRMECRVSQLPLPFCVQCGVSGPRPHISASSTAPFQALSRVGVLEGGCKAGEVMQFFCSLCLTSQGQFGSWLRSLTGSSSYGCLPFAVFPRARDRCHGSP